MTFARSLVILSLLLCRLAPAASASVLCEQTLQRFAADSEPAATLVKKLGDAVQALPAKERERTRRAVAAVLADFGNGNEPLPRTRPDFPALDAFQTAWFERVTAEGGTPAGSENNPLTLTDTTSVYVKQVTGDQSGFFRPLDSYSVEGVRYTLAASRLNELCRMAFVPKARMAKITATRDGASFEKLGVLSDVAPGHESDHTFARNKLLYLKRNLTAQHYHDVQGFQFLVGNRDVQTRNFNLTDAKGIVVFDHNLAFDPFLLEYDATRPVGTKLPERYTPTFLATLKELTPERLRSELSDLLLPQEISGLIFRRAVMLKDAELRGDKALATLE